MSNAPTKIIERIRALLALASNNPSEAEAASAAARAAALMAEHHLAQAEIEASGGETEADDIGAEILEEMGAQCATWKRVLLFGIRRLFHVEIVALPGKVSAFGRLSDVQTVRYMWAYLTQEIENLARRYWLSGVSPADGKRTVLNDFRRGAANRLQARMLDMLAEQDASNARASASPGALIVIQRGVLEVQGAFAAHLKALGLLQAKPTKTRTRGTAAAEAGSRAGDSMRISGGQPLGAEARRLGSM